MSQLVGRTLMLYLAAFLSFGVALLLFNSAFQKVVFYTELTNRHNLVYSYFQNLSSQITNAAVLEPELEKLNNASENRKFFPADSATIIRYLNQLNFQVRDPVNISIAAKLDTIVRAEISWLIASNVPDSIVHSKAPQHISAFRTIDSLLKAGNERTSFLISFREDQLMNEIKMVRIWMTVFILISSILIFYTTVNLLVQHKKRKTKEIELTNSLREVADYKFALDESSIVAITDHKGVISYVNDNFCKISKYTREELIGHDHRLINSGYHSKVFIGHIWQTIKSGKIWKGNLKNRAKDGTIYWVETTIVPFLDQAGKPYRYVAIRADITEKKEAEDRLVKNEKVYRTIASSIPGSVICLLDQEFRYQLIEGDMVEKLGYSKKGLLGNKAGDVLPETIYAELKPALQRVLDGETITVESQQSGFDIISKYIPLKGQDDVVYSIMTVSIDVSPLKRAQLEIVEMNRDLEQKVLIRTEELKKSNEDLESFSYSVSHDLRAPLRAIIGFSHIIKNDYAQILDAEGHRLLTKVITNTTKMGTLIDDLLAFSKTARLEIVKTGTNTAQIVKDVIESLTTESERSKISFKIEALQYVRADPGAIRQVWVNLVSNAIKYSSKKESPVIRIGSFNKDAHIVFYVTDNGAGFNEQYANKLFKVFQRLHNNSQFEGTGVGLAISERIISKHGGRIWAEGQENEGAAFYFSLPI